MVKGEQRVEKEISGSLFGRKVGFLAMNACGFNPATNEEKKKLGGYVKEDSEDPIYTNEKDGIGYAILDFYLQEVGGEWKYQKRFFLRNEVRKSKNKEKFNEAGEGRTQYINSAGWQAWAFSEKDLSEKFRAYDYHAARSGESEIISFLRALFALDWKAELSYDWKKILNGNFKEIAEDVKSYAKSVIIPLEVELKPTDGGVKEVQTNFNFFIPGDQAKFLNNKRKYTEKDIQAVQDKMDFNDNLWKSGDTTTKKKWITELEQAVVEIEKLSKHCYYLGVAKEFKKEDFEQASDVTKMDDEFDDTPAGVVVAGADDELDY